MASIKSFSAEQLLNAYVNGYFPMADSETKEILWYSPDPRAIIPIETYKPPKSLRSTINKQVFKIKINSSFEEVISACAAARDDENGTWISEEIIQKYCELNEAGFAHSIEAFYENKLAGGLYGVAIGGAFFGESMFYRLPNASKICFHFLMERLRDKQFELLDTQFINDNVLRYGAIEIPRDEYILKLDRALHKPIYFL